MEDTRLSQKQEGAPHFPMVIGFVIGYNGPCSVESNIDPFKLLRESLSWPIWRANSGDYILFTSERRMSRDNWHYEKGNAINALGVALSFLFAPCW